MPVERTRAERKPSWSSCRTGTEYGEDQHREARMEQMQKWISEFQLKLPEYDDVLVRHTVGRVVAVDTETIRVRIRDTDVEIEQKLEP